MTACFASSMSEQRFPSKSKSLKNLFSCTRVCESGNQVSIPAPSGPTNLCLMILDFRSKIWE